MTPDMPRAVPAKRGDSVFYAGKALLSTVDPVAACERLIAALPKDERTLYLCVSPLFGYGLARLLDVMHPSSALLCVEAEPSLADFTREHLSINYLPNTGAPRFALVTDPDPALTTAAVNAAASWGPRAFRRLVRFDLSSGAALYAGYSAVEDTLRHEISLAWENAATLIKLGRRYALNFLRNIRLLDVLPSAEAFCFLVPESARSASADPNHPSSKCMTPGVTPLGKNAAHPVHVLGAGPSLDRFFANYEGGPIVCVDTALPALRSHGRKADLVVALEAQHWNIRDFIGCKDAAAALAMDMSALPSTVGCIEGTVCLFFTPWTSLRLFDRMRNAGLLPLEMPPLGNVGITAYALARRLFPHEIVPHGLDFTFTIDQYHCRDSPGHIERLQKLDRFHSPLPTAAALRPSTFAVASPEGAVRQDPVMRQYRKLFGEVCRQDTPIEPLLHPRRSASRKSIAVLRRAFTQKMQADLTHVRNILSGREKAAGEELRALLNQNDILFAHYPDYAGTSRPAAIEDASFLKRIRAEIDAFINALGCNDETAGN
jgi:hypothetical protein